MKTRIYIFECGCEFPDDDLSMIEQLRNKPRFSRIKCPRHPKSFLSMRTGRCELCKDVMEVGPRSTHKKYCANCREIKDRVAQKAHITNRLIENGKMLLEKTRQNMSEQGLFDQEPPTNQMLSQPLEQLDPPVHYDLAPSGDKFNTLKAYITQAITGSMQTNQLVDNMASEQNISSVNQNMDVMISTSMLNKGTTFNIVGPQANISINFIINNLNKALGLIDEIEAEYRGIE